MIVEELVEARCVEDGHSRSEHIIYEALWNAAEPYNGDDTKLRVLTAGYSQISALCKGVEVHKVSGNLWKLISKLAIDRCSVNACGIGTTYVVYASNAIMDRRRAAGMTHVIKHGQEIRFIAPDSCRGPSRLIQ
jgi:hypothetical protein